MARTQFNPIDQTATYSVAAVNTVSATNTTADVSFVTLTVPANENLGACYSAKAYGIGYGAQGTLITFWVAVNGVKVASLPLTLANAFVSPNPMLWTLDAMITLGGTGAAASVRVDGEMLWNANVNTIHASGSATINQAASWTITLGCTIGVASASNTVTCNQALIRRF